MRLKFTRSALAKLPVPERGSVSHWDTLTQGFGLRITARGARTYVVKYSLRGAQRWYTLGRYDVLHLEEARERAREVLTQVAAGDDPAADRRQPQPPPPAPMTTTVEAFARRWLKEYAEPRYAHGTLAHVGSQLERIILPRIGSIPLADLKRRDVHAIHTSLVTTPGLANRVTSLIHRIMVAAERWGEVPEGSPNPAARVEFYPERAREVSLTREQRSKLFNALREERAAGGFRASVARAIWLIALTGMRRGEVRTLRWADVDLDAGTIALREHKTASKAGLRLVPINSKARVILLETPAHPDATAFLFPGTRPAHAISDGAIGQALHRLSARVGLGVEATPHVLRHTWASVAGQAGESEALIAANLGHKLKSVTSRYTHLDLPAIAAASERIADLIEPGDHARGRP